MVTSIDEIKKATAPEEVVLSGWGNGTEFYCRLKRPTFYAIAAGGQVPNPLLSTMEGLFTAALKTGETDKQKEAQCLMHIARCAMVEPSFAELENNGIALTDRQLLEIYAYALQGVSGLRSFRRNVGGGAADDEQGDAQPAE